MVTVASHRIETAQLATAFRQPRRHHFQSFDDNARKTPGSSRSRVSNHDPLNLLGQRRGIKIHLTDSSASVRGSVACCQPQRLDDVVEPHQSQGDSGHVEAGDKFSHLRIDNCQASFLKMTADVIPQYEELLVFSTAQPVNDRHHSSPRILGPVSQQSVNEHGSHLVCGAQGLIVNAGLTVDPHAHAHLACLDSE